MGMSKAGQPEDLARADIDRLLTAAGWLIQNRDALNIEAGRGIAIREFPLAPGHGFGDYLLYIDGYAVGVVEAKNAGVPLIGVEIQTNKYSEGLPVGLPAPRRPLFSPGLRSPIWNWRHNSDSSARGRCDREGLDLGMPGAPTKMLLREPAFKP
jgi:hypothetical protein